MADRTHKVILPMRALTATLTCRIGWRRVVQFFTIKWNGFTCWSLTQFHQHNTHIICRSTHETELSKEFGSLLRRLLLQQAIAHKIACQSGSNHVPYTIAGEEQEFVLWLEGDGDKFWDRCDELFLLRPVFERNISKGASDHQAAEHAIPNNHASYG